MATYEQIILATSGLAAYWRLGESSGNALDSSGNGNAATVKGGVARAVAGIVPGATGGACELGGTDGEIEASLSLGDAYSMEAWFVNQRDPGADLITGYLLSRGALSGSGTSAYDAVGILGSLNPGDDGKLFLYNGTDLLTGTTATVTDELHHVVFVRNGTNVKLYLDGELQINDTFAISYANSEVCAGRRVDNSFPFDGVIDEVAFYDGALSAGAVAAHLSSGTAPRGTRSSRISTQFQLRPY